ncbi:MAG TPA: hypothetical protein VGJ15_01675 [Pirellulales bacterium]|jgi:hypothetical protein
MQWLRIALALVVIGSVYFWRLDQPMLWGDEADTGIFARNVLRCGVPAAYDSRNVSIYENGAQLSRNLLLSKKIPWVQYYVGAASLAIFGNTTAGLRALFAVIGLVSFFPIWAILKRKVAWPEVFAAIALLAPQIVFFQRNARYYSILIFLYSVLVWTVSTEFKTGKTRGLIAASVFVFLFHTHPLAAACSGVSLLVYCGLFERKTLAVYAAATAVGFAAWLAWYLALGPALGESETAISHIGADFSGWLQSLGSGIAATIFDLDAVDCFPLLAWLGVMGLLLVRNRKSAAALFKSPLPCLVLLNLAIQIVATAAIFGTETGQHYALLRYEPHLLLFSLLTLFVMAGELFGCGVSAENPNAQALSPKIGCALACGLVAALNVFTVSYWYDPYPREIPISWVPPVYSEVFSPPENVWDAIIAELNKKSSDAGDRNTVLAAAPAWTDEALIFYLGDRFLVPPMFDPPSPACEEAIRQRLGEEAYRRLAAPATWGLDFLGLVDQLPPGAAVAATFPSHRQRPDDGTRPELTRHTFAQSQAVGEVKLFRLRQP